MAQLQIDLLDEYSDERLHHGEFESELYQEQWPTAAVPDPAICARRLPHSSPSRALLLWVARTPDGVAGGGRAAIPRSRLEPCDTAIFVRLAYRRQGIGGRVFQAMLDHLAALGIKSIQTTTMSDCPGGQALVSAQGWAAVRTSIVSEIDLSQVRDTSDESRTQMDGVTIQIVSGEYPERLLPGIAHCRASILAGYRQRQVAPVLLNFSHEIRSEEGRFRALGIQRIAIVACDTTGATVGCSEFVWDPLKPDVLRHIGLAVVPRFRKCGLEWALTSWRYVVAREFPSVTRIRIKRLLAERSSLVGSVARAHGSHHAEVLWRVRV